jgi:lipid-A-disaccharide synthase
MGKPTIFIVAGEHSGDNHASKLMSEIVKLEPGANFIGIGGTRMIEKGLKCIVPMEKISVVGFAEVLKNIRVFTKTFKLCKSILEAGDIDLLILVDFPGFNLRIAEIAHNLGIPVCYYIAPQLWAWGKNRINSIRKYVDLLLVVFPFEKEFFSRYVHNVEFVGHPLLDEEAFQNDFLSFEERDNAIAILPGSRRSEILYHKQLVKDLALLIKKELPGYTIKIPVADISFSDIILKSIGIPNLVQIATQPYEVMSQCKIGIIKSGTSNLEAALLGLPFVMFYKTSLPTYLIARRLVKVEYLSIINILLNGRYIPEFIQKDAKAEKIVYSVKTILNNRSIYSQFQDAFKTLKSMLGNPGASQRAAQKILDFFGI